MITPALMMGYLLSIGPMICLENHDLLPGGPLYDMLVLFYHPIAWCIENKVEPVATCMQGYIDLWQ